MSEIDPRALRHAFGAFPTGVTVVTAWAGDGTPVGFTANSFTSVSLDPPLLLVCPGRALSCFPVFETCARFAVNVLADGQEEVSSIFAGFRGDRFSRVSWRGADGAPPVLEGVAAHFVCRTDRIVPAGDHVLLIGAVETFGNSGREGLGYARGRYFSPAAASEVPDQRRYG